MIMVAWVLNEECGDLIARVDWSLYVGGCGRERKLPRRIASTAWLELGLSVCLQTPRLVLLPESSFT